ncbi:shikimate dehydrogenase [bacterium]|jgi:shikimate dehydrogenase|nr:shikimate dehydrogenase [bacterium]MBT3849842.1 shikimate dehydrogenase [bacterium]MBT4434969.1 shikimate dehydrogenase [bacterium]MDG2445644.1 shikimate dehydrogenase [Thermodesulfobacteriota bacterium]NSW99835.1 shikimate dehydrogenase [bacterium]|tara:strand:- start:2903 stop:3745 length:843 start_codon:yes stop_codon:yes gene_type:complete
MIHGNTRVYSVIGNPVKHSKSPDMHNAAFQSLGINGCYIPLEPKSDELEIICNLIRSGTISGSNVTIPYKEDVMKYVDTLTEEASMIGSVNTMYSLNGSLVGDNTDGLGFKRSLFSDLGFDAINQSALIIGAGGASKAVTAKLCQAEIKTLGVLDIDVDKANELIDHINKFNYKTKVLLVDSKEINDFSRESNLIVNCTPIGMKQDDPLLVSPEVFSSNQYVYDLVYIPSETKLLKAAIAKGANVTNGIDMLAYQGAESFSIWESVEPPYEIMKKELRNG